MMDYDDYNIVQVEFSVLRPTPPTARSSLILLKELLIAHPVFTEVKKKQQRILTLRERSLSVVRNENH